MAFAIQKFSNGNKSRAACTEENELLNTTSVKMTEAPFGSGRSDSDEDDIVEDYDEGVSFKTPCLRSRTHLERLLLVVLLVCFVIIIGLAVGLTRPQIVPVTKYCKTSSCVKAAGSLLSSIDWSVEPCNDFYKFACGQWLRTHPIPRGYHHWDRFQELSGHNLYVLSNLIDSNSPAGGSSFDKTRALYRSCMAATPERRQQILQQFTSLIDEIGGWSLSANNSLEHWSLMIGLEAVHKLGVWPFFKLKIEADEREPTKRNIIKIDLGETVLPSILKPAVNTTDKNGSIPVEMKDADKLTNVFLDETIHLFTSFGDSIESAKARAHRMLKIEEHISKPMLQYHHVHDRFSLYNVMTVAEVEHNFTMVNWIQYLVVLGFHIEAETEVVVMYPDYMANITEFVLSFYHGSDDNKRDLRDYLALSVLRSFKQYFERDVFEIKETEEDSIEEPWKRCTFYTNKALGFSTGAMYVKSTGSEDSVKNMERLITFVKIAFKDHLLGKFWMDKVTRKKAEKKVDAIIDKISYPSYILNDTFLDEYYEKFKIVPHDWLANLVSWRRFLMEAMNKELKAVPDRKTSWLRPPVTENAFYSATRNDVIFPIAMFHLPFYIPDGPSAVNFGAMGSIIGHEITHAFDIQGRQYDGQGKLSDWWDEETSKRFQETTTCMKDQYSDITVKGARVDGDFTLDENIADNGGLRAAMFGYQMWTEDFGEELQLPGLNMSTYQIFYTSFAQMYCSKWTDAGLYLHLLTDPHTPGSARVNAALANSETFSWAFGCPLGSKMSPRTRLINAFLPTQGKSSCLSDGLAEAQRGVNLKGGQGQDYDLGEAVIPIHIAEASQGLFLQYEVLL
ncbi:endothelin-converting enzyme 1 [Plakobranchus ocellatus]|uniref:Endothelin-converting enzyme 1 n=1 Tax=Plakobranchus ocellatus TaxID=259542 RepID=A0AAV4E212_9GAST|nr:endothelin-converting enzyme 1 [Plakobranchus ocellatus]